MKLISDEMRQQMIERSAKWDFSQSHSFVSNYEIENTISKYDVLFQKHMNQHNAGLTTGMFNKTSAHMLITNLIEQIYQHTRWTYHYKQALIGHYTASLGSDLMSKIIIGYYENNAVDYAPIYNSAVNELEQILQVKSNSLLFDIDLAATYNLEDSVDPQAWKLDRMSHICSALYEMLEDIDAEPACRLAGFAPINMKEYLIIFIQKIIQDFDNLGININDSISHDELYQDCLYSIESAYNIDADITGSITHSSYNQKVNNIHVNVSQMMHMIITNILTPNVWELEIERYNIYVNEIINTCVELNWCEPTHLDVTPHEITENYVTLKYLITCNLLYSVVKLAYDTLISTNGVVDCFDRKVCKDLTALTAFCLTKNILYLDYFGE